MAGLPRRAITDEERAQLATWHDSGRTSLYIRSRIVLLGESTGNAAAIARVLGVHDQTVRKTLRRFSAGGLAGIAPKPHPGPKRVFDEGAADALVALLHQSPAQCGDDEGRWTLASAAKALANELGMVSVSTETVRRLLKGRRYSWQRAKEWLESPDPEYAGKKSADAACSTG